MPSMQLWCLPHHCDGTPLKKADTMCGIALQHARKRKEDRYPELCGLVGRARLSRLFFFDVMFCVCFLTLIVMVCNAFASWSLHRTFSATSCRFYIFCCWSSFFTSVVFFTLDVLMPKLQLLNNLILRPCRHNLLSLVMENCSSSRHVYMFTVCCNLVLWRLKKCTL